MYELLTRNATHRHDRGHVRANRCLKDLSVGVSRYERCCVAQTEGCVLMTILGWF